MPVNRERGATSRWWPWSRWASRNQPGAYMAAGRSTNWVWVTWASSFHVWQTNVRDANGKLLAQVHGPAFRDDRRAFDAGPEEVGLGFDRRRAGAIRHVEDRPD